MESIKMQILNLGLFSLVIRKIRKYGCYFKGNEITIIIYFRDCIDSVFCSIWAHDVWHFSWGVQPKHLFTLTGNQPNSNFVNQRVNWGFTGVQRWEVTYRSGNDSKAPASPRACPIMSGGSSSLEIRSSMNDRLKPVSSRMFAGFCLISNFYYL